MFKTAKVPSTPLIIGFILGKMAEENLRRALQASNGDISVFFTRPISLVFIAVAVVFLFITIKNNYKRHKAGLAEEAEEEG